MLYLHTSWYYFSLHKIYLFKVVWEAKHQMLKKGCVDKSSVLWQFLRKPMPFPTLRSFICCILQRPMSLLKTSHNSWWWPPNFPREKDVTPVESDSLEHSVGAQCYEELRHILVFFLPSWQNFSRSLTEIITPNEKNPQNSAFLCTSNQSMWNVKGGEGVWKITWLYNSCYPFR